MEQITLFMWCTYVFAAKFYKKHIKNNIKPVKLFSFYLKYMVFEILPELLFIYNLRATCKCSTCHRLIKFQFCWRIFHFHNTLASTSLTNTQPSNSPVHRIPNKN